MSIYTLAAGYMDCNKGKDKFALIGVSKGFFNVMCPRFLENISRTEWDYSYSFFASEFNYEPLTLCPLVVYARSLDFFGEKYMFPYLKYMTLRHLTTASQYLEYFDLSHLDSLTILYHHEDNTEDKRLVIKSVKYVHCDYNNDISFDGYFDEIRLNERASIDQETFKNVKYVGSISFGRTFYYEINGEVDYKKLIEDGYM